MLQRFASCAVGIGCGVGLRSAGAQEQPETNEKMMRENLAKRLAKMYRALGKVESVVADDRLAFIPTSGAEYPVKEPCVVTVTSPEVPIEVRFPGGFVVAVDSRDLHTPDFLAKLQYWQSVDPDMATAILSYIAQHNQGKIRL